MSTRAVLLGLVAAMLAAVGAGWWVGAAVRPSAESDTRADPPPLLDNQATPAQERATEDSFGISFLHRTRPRGTFWESQWQGRRSFDGVDPVDPWFDADHGTASYRVADGQLWITGEHPRMYVYDPDRRRQWRDVEVTVYFKRIADRDIPYAGMTAVARSNHLETESGTQRCDTRGIGARIRYDGHIDFEKETAFPLNEATNNREVWPDGMPYGRWIGMKYVVRDRSDGVNLELWTDLSEGRRGGDWKLASRLVDNGQVLGQVPCAPGINPRMALTAEPTRAGSETGLPNLTVFFRSDGVARDGLTYKWASIREITGARVTE